MSTFSLATLVRPNYLRALRLARRPIPEAGGNRDPAVLDLIEEPFRSPADAHDRLAELERLFRERSDRRSVFLTVYERVTGEIAAEVEAGSFEDGAWVAAYLVAFADLYREALLAFERGDPGVPAAWRLAFGVAAEDDGLLVQHALLGVNAHITRDLAFALDRVGIDPDRERRFRDHVAVSEVLERVVEDIQQVLAESYAPGIAALDESFGRLDERLAFFSVHQARLYAWQAAVAFADARWSFARDAVQWLVETTATGAGQFVLGPAIDRATFERLRDLEAGARGDQLQRT